MFGFYSLLPQIPSNNNKEDISAVSVFMELKTVNESPSTRDVSNVTLAALRLPAGKLSPIFSSFSLRHFPPFLDFAL